MVEPPAVSELLQHDLHCQYQAVSHNTIAVSRYAVCRFSFVMRPVLFQSEM